MNISFGTDGWRDIIGDKFTFDNVKIYSQGLANYLNKKKEKSNVIVGYDTRFLSKEIAFIITKILTSNGINVFMTDGFVPIPLLSFSVKNYNMDLGIMITASHNPYLYNGIKIRGKHGEPIPNNVVQELKEEIYSVTKIYDSNGKDSIFINPLSDYQKHIYSFINKENIKYPSLLILDSLYGATQNTLKTIFKPLGIETKIMHNIHNPNFGGLNPDPILPNLNELRNEILFASNENYEGVIGFGYDGDGDRLGIIDEKGNFINPNTIFALLCYHLLKNKGYKGNIVKSLTTTNLINKIAENYNSSIIETPVGFKYIAEESLNNDFLIGGEESGGFTIQNHFADKDGILTSLLIIDLINTERRKLYEIIEDIEKSYGRYYNKRLDIENNSEAERRIIHKLKSEFKPEIINTDGLKLVFNENDWCIIRKSGTENKLRIYIETKSKTFLKEIVFAINEVL